jgi:hypothetical protein
LGYDNNTGVTFSPLISLHIFGRGTKPNSLRSNLIRGYASIGDLKFKIPYIKPGDKFGEIPKGKIPSDYTDFSEASDSCPNLKSKRGGWRKCVVGDLTIDSRVTLVNNIKEF